MATNSTLVENIVNPEVMATMIQAELEKKLQATMFMKVNRELVGRPGDTITVPTWLYIGMADDLPEDETGTITPMEVEMVDYTVKKAVKNVAPTDEVLLAAHGDPVGEINRQLRLSIADKIDQDAVTELEKINATNGHLHTASTSIDYSVVVEALDKLKLEEQGTDLFLLVNHTTIKNIRLDPRFVERQTQLSDEVFGTGVVGSIAGCRIVISNKLPDTRSYILTPESITVFFKRDVQIETQRELLRKRTIIGSDSHYVVAIEDYDKIVAIQHTA